MSDLHTRFGPPPSSLDSIAPSTLLAGQLIVCVVALLAIQPPFVMQQTQFDQVAHVSFLRVVAFSTATVALTFLLHSQKCSTMDVVRRACETVHRAIVQ